MTVELLYDRDCPNVAATRSRLLEAFAQAGLPARWSEWDLAGEDTPAAHRGRPSPSVLVDGRDVLGAEAAGDGPGCRLYRDAAGALDPAPPVEAIVQALRASGDGGVSRRSLTGGLAALAGIGPALLPNLTCPACWPVYAGLLSTLGLGFLLDERWLLPLTIVGLALLIAALAWRAARRNGSGPALVAGAAAVVLVATKFWWPAEAVAGGAVGALVVAAVWNLWPPRRPVASDTTGRAGPGSARSCCPPAASTTS